MAYVFDDLHMKPEELAFVRNAAVQHLSTSHDPSERAAIFTTSQRTLIEFTADRDRLRTAMLNMIPGGSHTDHSRECPPMSVFMADLIVNRHDQRALGVAIADYMDCAGPMPGNADRIVEAAARNALALADADAGTVLETLDGAIRKLATVPGQRSIVLASPGFLMDGPRIGQESVLIDRAIRVKVVLHALDARGLNVRIPGGNASQSGGNVDTLGTRVLYQRQAALQQSNVLAELASGTGGRFFENSNDAVGALALTGAPEYLYVLGFIPESLKLDGKFHPLKVALRNPKGLAIEARRGYRAPSFGEDESAQGRQAIEEAFFSREETRDLPVDLQIQFLKNGDDGIVAVLAKLDLNQIPFRRDADRNCDDISVVAGLFDQNGNFISGVQKVLEMRLRDETLERRKATGYTVRTDFSVKPGYYLVRLVARDSEGKRLTARGGVVEVP